MTGLEVALLAVAGLAAGAANTIAGGGTFISYPTLIAMGYPPITANVTSAVGLVSGYAGGSMSYRREIAGQGRRLLAFAPSVVVGAIAGALLLLFTPGEAFEAIVPWLILLACLLLFGQPKIKRYVKIRREHRTQEAPSTDGSTDAEAVGIGAQLGIFVGAIYGTYFGAGLGVVLLAVLGVFLHDPLQRVNGLRTVLSLLIKTIGVAIFVFSGQVAWLAAGVLAITAYFGGFLGAAISRRMSETVLRWTVITCGVGVAAILLT